MRSLRRRSRAHPVLELVITVAVAVGLAYGIQALIIKPYRIPSGSMEPTLAIGQRILADRISHAFGPPSVGDIVVFHPPKGYEGGCADPRQGGGHPAACDHARPGEAGVTFIKRVVGGPGDRISIRHGHVIRNGKRESDGYIRPCAGRDGCNFPQTIVIPPDHWFMMGDNRGDSDDSRFWGPVPNSWIIGSAFFTYWPPSRVGGL